NTGRRGNVDLRKIAGDDIDADEQKPSSCEFRAERYANLRLPIGKRGGFGAPARGQVGADLSLFRQAIDRTRNLAVHQHDPLVTLGDIRKKGLHHEGLAPYLPEQFGERGKVRVVTADMEYRRARISIKRLHHHLAMLRMKSARLLKPTGDHRG